MSEVRVSLTLAAEPPAEPDWLGANDHAVDLALRWIAERLDGADGEEARQAWHEARARLAATGMPAAIDRVADAFALSAFEEDVLMIALAPQIDGSFGPRYAAAQGRPTAAPATPHLLARLLCGSDRLPAQALARLAPAAPLRARALVHVDDHAELAADATITVPERVRSLLCGVDEIDPLLTDHIRRLRVVPVPPRLAELALGLGAVAGPPRAQIVGPARSGRALATVTLAEAGLGATLIDASAVSGATAAALMRDATLDCCGIVVMAGGGGAALERLVREWRGALMLVAEQPVAGLDLLPILRFDPLDAEERRDLWRIAAPELDEDTLDRLAEQFDIGPDDIAELARQPRLREMAWATCRDAGARDLDSLALRIRPQRGWDDLVLAPETLVELKTLAGQIGGRALVHGQWGYRALLGRATGVSALFAGPSGVGKTLAAEAIAHALDLDLYLVDMARVTSKYIGETEKNLARLFEAAEGGGAVLFFDEADALFGKRSEVRDSHDRYANAEISYLLQRVERFGGLAILATNLKSHLDAAFLRRLRMIVDFPMPDVAARRALWRRALPDAAPLAAIDWERLARIELSGGNIMTVGINAAFRAAAQRTSIGMAHIAAALAAESRKLDREPLEIGL